MRADRLLLILLLLQTDGKLTTQQLAHKLEVSGRTIQRDMDALGMAGLPIISERGSQGGWSLLETDRARLFALNASEIQSLFLSYSPQQLKDLGLGTASEAALLKIFSALPEIQRREAELARRSIYIDLSDWKWREEQVLYLPLLQEALWRECKVRMLYSRKGSSVERVVAPLGLVAKGALWYLVAASEESIRTFRVSRVIEATLLQEPYLRPVDFDLEQYWKQWQVDFMAQLPRYKVLLRIPLAFIEPFARSPFSLEVVNQTADSALIQLQFERKEEAASFIFSYGAVVEIVEPPELQTSVYALARAILAQ